MGNRLRCPKGPEILLKWDVKHNVSLLALTLSVSLSLSFREMWAEREGKSKRISGNKLDVIITCGSSLLHTHSDSHRLNSGWLSQAGSSWKTIDFQSLIRGFWNNLLYGRCFIILLPIHDGVLIANIRVYFVAVLCVSVTCGKKNMHMYSINKWIEGIYRARK